MNGEKIIKLTEPVTVGSKTVTELRIRPLKAKHLRGIKIGYDGIDTDVMLDLASKITGELPAVIDERFIPTHVGNAQREELPRPYSAVHPHTRGERMP